MQMTYWLNNNTFLLYFILHLKDLHYGKKLWLSKNNECDWNHDTFDRSGEVVVCKCDSDGYIIHIQLGKYWFCPIFLLI